MLVELCRLVGAQVGISGSHQIDAGGRAQVMQVVDVGWESDAERQSFHGFLQTEGLETEPIVCQIQRLPGRLITRTREQVIDDRDWYGSLHHDFRRPCRIDHCVISFYRPNDRQPISSITVHRALGARPFSRRERWMIHLLHEELGPQIGEELAGASEPSASDLSPRLRETLRHLLQGASEKEAAAKIGLSRATVHEYVTSLYRHFDVRSRGELLAYWLTRGRRPPTG